MQVNFREAEKYLLSLGNEVAAMKLGLDSVRTLLRALGDPQNSYLKVQVAGTNGKGSVCAFLDSICGAAGVRAGLYTSPHLVSVTERVRIKGEDISPVEFARIATLVRQTSEQLAASGELDFVPTFFEQVTAIALVAFAESQVEVAILETGLGGRLDATTAANAEICGITRIDIDHQQYLGGTIQAIASEKAAIIHSGCAAFIGEQPSAAIDPILSRCEEVGVKPVFTDFLGVRSVDGGFVITTECTDYEVPRIGLHGSHQLENAKLAMLIAEELARRFNIAKAYIPLGLERAKHAGRLEYAGRYLFDGAHNTGGAHALASYLDDVRPCSLTLVFGAMNDKPANEILQLLAPRAERIVLTQPANERSLHYDELLSSMPADLTKERTFVTDSVGQAIDIAENVTPEDGIILVTGSLYLVGEVKRELNARGSV